jgi:hypothetical protein
LRAHPATAIAQKTTEIVRSFEANDARPADRSQVAADPQQLSASCAGPATAMLINPIQGEASCSAFRNKISHSKHGNHARKS